MLSEKKLYLNHFLAYTKFLPYIFVFQILD